MRLATKHEMVVGSDPGITAHAMAVWNYHAEMAEEFWRMGTEGLHKELMDSVSRLYKYHTAERNRLHDVLIAGNVL